MYVKHLYIYSFVNHHSLMYFLNLLLWIVELNTSISQAPTVILSSFADHPPPRQHSLNLPDSPIPPPPPPPSKPLLNETVTLSLSITDEHINPLNLASIPTFRPLSLPDAFASPDDSLPVIDKSKQQQNRNKRMKSNHDHQDTDRKKEYNNEQTSFQHPKPLGNQQNEEQNETKQSASELDTSVSISRTLSFFLYFNVHH